ncbi:hypothetical protein ISR94_01495 [Candidatus Microgenomates bacterium]|nr:hypothetical protein [Candidatus Microgenomates bacterium]
MSIFGRLKKIFYFPIAYYFAVFAKVRLLLWKPIVVVITGSSGKTTLLHMIASQLGDTAKYSFKANSSYGIPFDILGLKRESLTVLEWPKLFLFTPFIVFKPLPKQKIYIAEVDCDRVFEGKFLGKLLKPNITLWINTTKTHSMNFESKSKRVGKDILSVITEEFGQLAKNTKDLVIYNQDSKNLQNFIKKMKVKQLGVSRKDFEIKYNISFKGTEFYIDKTKYSFAYLLPEVTFYQIIMCCELVNLLGTKMDLKFKNFKAPPGRSSIFKGIRNTTLVDSTYNSNLDSMKVILQLFDQLKSENKWIVVGDMLEQGKNEIEEHKKLAEIINTYNFDKVVLMGPRVGKIVSPLVENSVVFEMPDKVLSFLKENLKGEEAILFKGARFLEGVVGALLLNKSNSKNLVRREKVWQKRREKFGL